MKAIIFFIIIGITLISINSYAEEIIKKPVKMIFERSDGSVYEKMAGSENFVEIVPGRENELITNKLKDKHQKIVVERSNGDKVYSYNFKDWYDNSNNSIVESSQLAEDLPEFLISPNPSNGEYLVSFELEQDSKILISIYTYNGTKISDILNTNHVKGTFSHSFNINRYTSGVYVYQMVINNQIFTYKIVKN